MTTTTPPPEPAIVQELRELASRKRISFTMTVWGARQTIEHIDALKSSTETKLVAEGAGQEEPAEGFSTEYVVAVSNERHKLRAELAEAKAQSDKLKSQIVQLHDAACRKGQPANHDFFGCALEGTEAWRSSCRELEKERDEAKAEVEKLRHHLVETAVKSGADRASLEGHLDAANQHVKILQGALAEYTEKFRVKLEQERASRAKAVDILGGAAQGTYDPRHAVKDALKSLDPDGSIVKTLQGEDHDWILALDGAYDPSDWRCGKCGKECDGARPPEAGCPGRPKPGQPADLDPFGVSASDERIVDGMMAKAAEGREERPIMRHVTNPSIPSNSYTPPESPDSSARQGEGERLTREELKECWASYTLQRRHDPRLERKMLDACERDLAQAELEATSMWMPEYDPDDSERLRELRDAIDEHLGWRNQLEEDGGDYVERVRQVGAQLKAESKPDEAEREAHAATTKRLRWYRAAHLLVADEFAWVGKRKGDDVRVIFLDKDENYDPILWVMCSDTFAWSTADAERADYVDAEALLEIARKDGWFGLIRWVEEQRSKRGQIEEPIAPVKKMFADYDSAKAERDAALEELRAEREKAPRWKDAPDAPGFWFNAQGDEWELIGADDKLIGYDEEGARWFGPIVLPEDKWHG